jgi:uncharacterized repeat protein (TIGR02543 family)
MKKIIKMLSVFVMLLLIGSISTQIVKAETKVKSIVIKTKPDKLAYKVGESYSTKGMVVIATMSDGKKETIDNSLITSFSGVELTEGRPFTKEGWKSVEIRYKGVKTTYGIAVFDSTKEYYITYDSNGGSPLDSNKIDASTKVFKLPVPTKKGSTFLGWYHSNGMKYTKYEPGMGPSLKLKAKWGSAIIFNANGGKGNMKNGVISDDFELPKSGFTKKGYKFVGWSTVKVATDESNFYEVGAKGSYLAAKNKNVTLYAQWVKTVTYKISYTSVKGVKMPTKAIKKYTAGKVTNLPTANVTGEGNFAGWMITFNGKKSGPYMEIPPYVSGNIKLTPFVVEFEG